MSWNVFWIFALVSVLLWLAGSLCALYGRKRLSEQASSQDERGDQAMVFLLHDALGPADIYALGIQVDSGIFPRGGVRVHLPEHIQAGDS